MGPPGSSWTIRAALFVGFLLIALTAQAAELTRSAQASGGPQASAGYQVRSAVGEPAVGLLSGSSKILTLGFLATDLDSTPPTTPVVTDDGDWTTSLTILHAFWASSDPESGIVEYQYQIRQDASDGPLVVDWTSTGTVTYVIRDNLVLANGKMYYLLVRARNGAGRWSSIGTSDGILVDTAAAVAAISSPAEGTTFLTDDSIPLVGSANGANFSSYSVEYGVGPSPETFTLLTTFSSPTAEETLYTLDFHVLRFRRLELPPGLYTIRLTVRDTAGKVSRVHRRIFLDYLYLSEVSADPFLLDPYAGESALVRYRLDRPANVVLRIYRFPTRELVRTFSMPSQTAGAQTVFWNGRDSAEVILTLAVYYFTVEATDISGHRGTYNRESPPLPGPTPSTLNPTVEATGFDPYRNDLVRIQYSFTDLGWATIWISDSLGFVVRIIQNLAVRTGGAHEEVWDGRRQTGRIYQGPFNVSFGAPRVLPLHAIVLDRSPIEFNNFRAEAYLVQPLFGEVSTLTYTLTQDANVSMTITDPNGNVIRTLLSNVTQKGGPKSIEWDGRTDTGQLVSVEGDYTVTLTAVDSVSGVSTKRLGSILMYK